MAYRCMKITINPKSKVWVASGTLYTATTLSQVSNWLNNNIGIKLTDETETTILENLDDGYPVLSTDSNFLIIPHYD